MKKEQKIEGWVVNRGRVRSRFEEPAWISSGLAIETKKAQQFFSSSFIDELRSFLPFLLFFFSFNLVFDPL
ncbi:hypothetical protein Csa_000414 [Cucumis sativus]|uniref:Uncharacterized protein n=1 Tax=Cucumis sativus TaxID=3659 RepID=A0A0A0KMJ1_CUCSA|nr:hypothetical protein Csa_000414 [Cucumis sativus]